MKQTNENIRLRSRMEGGFTAIELVVVMSIMLILASTGVSNLSGLQLSFQRNEAINMFEFDVRRIKSEALAEGARGVLSVGVGNILYSYGIDYPPYNSPAAADSNMVTRTLPGDVTISFSQTLVFNSRGYLINEDGTFANATFTLTSEGSSFNTGTLLSIGFVCREGGCSESL